MSQNKDALAYGAHQYADVLKLLSESGLKATFTQTGGMNAAIHVLLDGGWSLLLTDEEDALSWDRPGHCGWGVGLYEPGSEYDEGPIVFESDADDSLETLSALIRRTLRRMRPLQC